MILCSVLKTTKCIEINCSNLEKRYIWKEMYYVCHSKGLLIETANVSISDVKAAHMPGKTNKDVTSVQISNQRTKFLPIALKMHFPNIKDLQIVSSSLSHIQSSDFSDLLNLEVLNLIRNPIKSIPEDCFNNMKSMEILSISSCEIKELSKNTFRDLVNLKKLWLRENQLERLDGNLFATNAKLEELILYQNKLHLVGSQLLTPLKALKVADFRYNPCTNKRTPDDVTMQELTQHIQLNCRPTFDESASIEDTIKQQMQTIADMTNQLQDANLKIKELLSQIEKQK